MSGVPASLDVVSYWFYTGFLWSQTPLSDFDYLELTRVFDEQSQSGAVSAFADIVRRTLTPKLPLFTASHPRSLAAAAASGD